MPWSPWWLGLSLLWVAAAGATQEADKSGIDAELATAPTVEEIQSRIKQYETSGEVSDPDRAVILERYKAALEQLRLAEEWSAKAAGFEKARAAAPAELEAIRAELVSPASEPKIAPPPEATLAQLEQWTVAAEADWTAAAKAVSELDGEFKRRADRRVEVPGLIAAAHQRRTQADAEHAANASGGLAEVSSAAHALWLARKKSCASEILAYEQELLSYDARGELLSARRESTQRRVADAEATLKLWRAAVADRRRAEAEAAAQAARQTRRAWADAHPIIVTLADGNAALADRRTGPSGLATMIEEANRALESVNAGLAKLKEDHAGLSSRVKAVGRSKVVALLLRQHRERLPDLRAHRRQVKQWQSALAQVQYQLLELDDERSSLSDLRGFVQRLLSDLPPDTGEAEREEIASTATDLLQVRRGLVDSLTQDCDRYFSTAVDLIVAEQALVTEATGFQRFIEENILWVSSAATLGVQDVVRAVEGLKWLTAPTMWRATWASLSKQWGTNPLTTALTLGGLICVVVVQPGLRRRLSALGELASRPSWVHFGPTVAACVQTALMASALPFGVWLAGWYLETASETPESCKAVAAGFDRLAYFLFQFQFLRQVCRPKGLAEAHFGWSPTGLATARRHTLWFMAATAPLVFIVSAIDWGAEDASRDALGRVAYIVGHLIFAVFQWAMLRPSSGAFQNYFSQHQDTWLWRFRHAWLAAAIGLPVFQAGLVAAGYFYTGHQFSLRLQWTLRFVLVLVLVRSLLFRWLLVARRKLAVQRAKQLALAARAESARLAGEAAGAEPVSPVLTSDTTVSLTEINVQTRRLIQTALVAAIAVGCWVTWRDVLPALGVLRQVELWTTTATIPDHVEKADGTVVEQSAVRLVPVTLSDLGQAILVLLVAVIAYRNIPGLLEITLLQRLGLDSGARFAVTTLTRYVITTVGIVLSFKLVGVGWPKVQWLAAAVTFGLGFGLQEIFANFVSGLIILFERPIRVGDTLTVGDITGAVTRIRIRATTILDWDRRELIIPNKEFVTGRIVNWTLSDRIVRVLVRVGVAYGSDLARARELLLAAARKHPQVVDDPAPSAMFTEFGDSALILELRTFVRSREANIDVLDVINTEVERSFREAGIAIAFPQMDVHIQSISSGLASLDTPPAGTR